MSLLVGLGLLPLLILANYLVIDLCKNFPKYILAISGIMIGLDSVLTLGYTFVVKIIASDEKLMALGIGLSIFLALTHKVLVMIKVFRVMFKNEIGN